MKLIAFTVRNYRSILEAYKLALENYTVLVGPNNEGKSNILKGIVLSLNVMTRGRVYTGPRRGPVRYYRAAPAFDYEWVRDFPVSLQSTWPDGKSEFTLEFDLTEQDFELFKEKVGVNLATNLKIRLHFGHEDADFEVLMKGRGKQTLNSKRREIADFIREHIT